MKQESKVTGIIKLGSHAFNFITGTHAMINAMFLLAPMPVGVFNVVTYVLSDLVWLQCQQL